MRTMALLVGALTALCLAQPASAVIFDIHAKGSVTGALPGIIFPASGTPLELDAFIDYDKGSRLSSMISEAIGGSGVNSPGLGDLSLDVIGGSGWGSASSSMTFSHSPSFSFLNLRLSTNFYRLTILGTGPASRFADLDAPPTGNACPAGSCTLTIEDLYDSSKVATGTIDELTFTERVAAVAVPEPSTWALMILGFGFAGSQLRRRRHAFA